MKFKVEGNSNALLSSVRFSQMTLSPWMSFTIPSTVRVIPLHKDS